MRAKAEPDSASEIGEKLNAALRDVTEKVQVREADIRFGSLPMQPSPPPWALRSQAARMEGRK